MLNKPAVHYLPTTAKHNSYHRCGTEAEELASLALISAHQYPCNMNNHQCQEPEACCSRNMTFALGTPLQTNLSSGFSTSRAACHSSHFLISSLLFGDDKCYSPSVSLVVAFDVTSSTWFSPCPAINGERMLSSIEKRFDASKHSPRIYTPAFT